MSDVDTTPNIERYEVDLAPQVAAPGRLSVMPAPRSPALDGWARALAQVGVTDVACLLDTADRNAFGLGREPEHLAAHGVRFHAYGIDDFGLPTDDATFASLIRALAQRLHAGGHVAVHCLAGIGRSGMTAGCTMKTVGFTADEAIARLSRARGCPVPDTAAQADYIRDFTPRA
ncbi:MAG: protein-tyrosine phosphatase family protein [Pseudomonadota bacterium]